MVNMNYIAVDITKVEGKKKETDIAQIKEIIKCYNIRMSQETIYDQIATINRYADKSIKLTKKELRDMKKFLDER